MSSNSGKKYSEKHGEDAKPDPILEKEIQKRLKDQAIPCAVIFNMAKELKVSHREIAKTVDLLDITISKCQLGLFGYKPEKKKVKAETTSNQELMDAIEASAKNNRLPCEKAWEIAARFKTPKMKVSNICEGAGIKVKPCQLGAF
ncbi:MAG: hypothetical protein GY859_37175 [Desulfobacterales bacterium]|nr:hypothetical protein [Desulfobacterales bacterium]